MITINKQCVDAYKDYEELNTKLNTLRYYLEQMNLSYTGRESVESFYDIRIDFMRSLYNNHKELINKTLNEEVERLKQELNKYIIE